METNTKEIENIRVQFEVSIMKIEGVVGVGTGLCNGKPCLKIYTSIPPEKVRSRLPGELSKIELDLEYVGSIEAQ